METQIDLAVLGTTYYCAGKQAKAVHNMGRLKVHRSFCAVGWTLRLGLGAAGGAEARVL